MRCAAFEVISMNGIVIIDKPQDWTSQDVTARLRRVFNTRRIGHGGTLDPMATGVLPVFVGRATRGVEFFEHAEKIYEAVLRLGVMTDTEDITGTVLEQREVGISEEEFLGILPKFRGKIQQIPPMYSALKVNGQKLYDLARKGIEVERQSRSIHVEKLQLCTDDRLAELGVAKGDPCIPGVEYDLDAVCSKGTYIRTLCHDVGQALGCGGCMADLLRVRSGNFVLSQALDFAQVEELHRSGDLERYIIPTDRVFSDLPAVYLNEAGDERASHGAFLDQKHLTAGQIPPEGEGCRVYDSAGQFIMTGKGGVLDRGGEAIFCDKTFFNRD